MRKAIISKKDVKSWIPRRGGVRYLNRHWEHYMPQSGAGNNSEPEVETDSVKSATKGSVIFLLKK